MRQTLSFLVLLFCTFTALAEQMHYDFQFPGYKDGDYLQCDKYVRLHHKTFQSDMRALSEANTNKDWKLSNKIINNYNTDEGFIKNTFTQAVYKCGLGYKFSDGENHYRNLYADIFIMIISLKKSTDTNQSCEPDSKDLLVKINNTLNLIVNSTNKAANKALKRDSRKSVAHPLA